MPWTGSPGSQTFLRTDGTRTGAQTWTKADADGVDIVTVDHDLHDQDIADGLTSCLKHDGGNSVTANIPMGGFRLQNLGQALSRTDSVRAGDVQDNRLSYCTVGGTANTITLTNTLPITSYIVGQEFRFQATFSNTSSVTVAVDGLAAKALNVAGTALSAGQILAGAWITIAFDGIDFEFAIGTTPATVSVGTIMAWPTATVPAGWLECDGSAISRSTYAALFGIINTNYGPGNGSTTFNLPNYKNQFLRGFDASGTDAASRTDRGDGTTGALVGTKQSYDTKKHTHTFSGDELAAHGHPFRTGLGSVDTTKSDGGFSQDGAPNGSTLRSAFTGTPTTVSGQQIGGQSAGTPSGANSEYPAVGGNETRPVNVTVKWIILAVPSASLATAQIAPYFIRLLTDNTGANDTSSQPVFANGASTFTSPPNALYEFEALYFITRSAGTTSHNTSVLFGGTATISSCVYTIESTTTTGAPTSTTASQQLIAVAATATQVATTSTSSTENIVVKIKGTMTITTGGTVIPQFAYSTAPGGAPTIKAGSYIKFTPLGQDTTGFYGPVS